LVRTCFTFLFFIFKCMLIVQGSFTLVFHTYVNWDLIRLASSITYFFSITMLPYHSTLFSAFSYAFFIYRCNVFWHYSLSFSFPLLLPCIPTESFFLYIYIYVLLLFVLLMIAILTEWVELWMSFWFVFPLRPKMFSISSGY
jgi:hypothetical protein